MRGRYAIALCLLISSAPALACRSLVVDTDAKRAEYIDSIAARSHVVAVGRFAGKPREDRRRFVVRERVVGSSMRRFWVLDHRLTEGPNEIVFSCGVDTMREGEIVLVLRRRPENADYAPAFDADSCATSFLTDNPDALAMIRAGIRSRLIY